MSERNLTVKKERLFHINISLKAIFYVLLFILAILGYWYIVVYKEYIHIYFTEKKTDTSELYLYTVLVSIMTLLYFVACNFSFDVKKQKYRIVILGFIIYMIYLGFNNVGIGITFNESFDLLTHDTYESDSYQGVKFFVFNYYPLWITLYIISLIFQSEKK